MVKIAWGEVGSKQYTAGVDRGVFYPSLGPGVPWNGLLSVQETTTDVDIRIAYMDGQKVQTQLNLGTFAAQISAVTYPPEFDGYDGYTEDGWSSQSRKPFNFAYRTFVADDLVGLDYGYQIHLVFNALAEPVMRDHKSLSGSVDPLPFEWAISTVPVSVTDARPASHVVIDSTQAYPAALVAVENILYGTLADHPRFPTMQELLDLFETFAIFKVVDQGNGIATISGPDSAVFMTGVDTAQFTWPSVVEMNDDTYRLTSL